MRRSNRRRSRFQDQEDLNPMNYLSNLSDVMLVLSVGIMVALILHWNVPLNSSSQAENNQSNGQTSVSFTQDELREQEEIPDNMIRMGDVFYDEESGKYYIIQNEEGGE